MGREIEVFTPLTPGLFPRDHRVRRTPTRPNQGELGDLDPG